MQSPSRRRVDLEVDLAVVVVHLVVDDDDDDDDVDVAGQEESNLWAAKPLRI